MIKGLFINLSPSYRMALLLGLVLSMLLFSSLLGFLVLVPFMGSGILNSIANPDLQDPSIVNCLKALQIINMGLGLLLPALLFVYLTNRKPSEYLCFSPSRTWMPVWISIIFILAAQPLVGFANELNSWMQLPAFLSGVEEWMKNTESQAAKLTNAFLSDQSAGGLLLNIFMIALLPAITEEVLFRGVLARLLGEWTRSRHWAVVISAFIFAAIHLQFYGFLPRFLLGVAFGYLYFWTRNLWVPIMAHLINNLGSVLAEYFYRKGITSVNAAEFGFSGNYYWVVFSLVITVFLMIYYYRIRLTDENGI